MENELFQSDISETHWMWTHPTFEQKDTWRI